MVICPECDKELVFYADIYNGEISDFGGYYCNKY